jgi:hypothetical protein
VQSRAFRHIREFTCAQRVSTISSQSCRVLWCQIDSPCSLECRLHSPPVHAWPWTVYHHRPGTALLAAPTPHPCLLCRSDIYFQGVSPSNRFGDCRCTTTLYHWMLYVIESLGAKFIASWICMISFSLPPYADTGIRHQVPRSGSSRDKNICHNARHSAAVSKGGHNMLQDVLAEAHNQALPRT